MKKALIITIVLVFVGGVTLSSILIFTQEEAVIQKQTQSIPELRVAFIGDQGLGPNAIAVLELIKDEGARMVLHQGDFDYEDDPDKWDKQISNVLGTDFPYFGTPGNHDVKEWNNYQGKLYDRLKKNPDAECIGDLGVKSSCTYHGLFFILVAPGISDSDHDSFIKKQLNENHSNWRICSWHYDINTMQREADQNKTGWEVYEYCKNGGAIIANAYHHAYARTKTLINFENHIVDSEWSEPNKLRVKEGATFTFISGIGGMPIVKQKYDDWTINYSSDQGASNGALFCTFNVGGQPNKAYCYFKNVDGRIIDEFTITSFLGAHIDKINPTDVDWSGRDLTGNDLSNTTIIDTNLSSATLVGADLSNAVLIGTTLTGADLTDANLTGVSLKDKDLTGTILTGADLTDVSLTGVDLSGRDLTGTILRGADLTNANLTGVDLSGRDLTGTILRGMDLSDKDLTGTILTGADLTNANLTGVSLKDKDLTGTILTGTNLTDVVLPSYYLSGKNFRGTIFDGVDLSGRDLSESNFESASFKNTNMKNADLTSAKFVTVDLTKVKSLVGANLFRTTISYSNLSGNDLDGITLGYNNFQRSNLSGLDFTVTSNKYIESGMFVGADLSNANLEGFVFIAKDDLGNVITYPAVLTNGAKHADKSFSDLSVLFWEKGAYDVWVVAKKVVGNDLQMTIVRFTDFSSANLQNVNLSDADLTKAVFRNADLTNANLSNAVLTGAYLTGADLTDANLTGAVLDGAILNCKNHVVCTPDT